jgi:hypothetical protein
MTNILAQKHTQPDGSNPYEDWREGLLGIGHSKNWGVKFSPSWPVEYHGITSGGVIESRTTVSRSASLCADYNTEDNAVAKASAEEEAEEEKRHQLIALLQQKHPNPGTANMGFGLLAMLKK